MGKSRDQIDVDLVNTSRTYPRKLRLGFMQHIVGGETGVEFQFQLLAELFLAEAPFAVRARQHIVFKELLVFLECGNRFLGGTAPFGWRVDEKGGLLEVPDQQAMIRQILRLRSTGLSLRSISAKIDGTVSHVTVRNILSNADANEDSELPC